MYKKLLTLLIKADVNGSLEALINVIDSYQKYVESLETDNEPIVDIIDFGVGPVTDKVRPNICCSFENLSLQIICRG